MTPRSTPEPVRRGAGSLPEPGRVHVWRFDSSTLALEDVESLARTLTPEELTAADRLRGPLLRQRYLTSHAMTLAVLRSYLDDQEVPITFDRGPRGKPFILDPHGARRIRFNVAHSHALHVVAVSDDAEVGIDVERIRTDIPIDDMSALSLSEGELAGLAARQGDDRVSAFFDCWTRKEALLKGQGVGFITSPSEVHVGVGPSRGVAVSQSLLTSDGWTVAALDLAPGYAGAVALEGSLLAADLLEWRLPTRPNC